MSLYKYEVIQHLIGPYHTPGSGKAIYTWFSRSPKEASSRCGRLHTRFEGDDSQPCVMEEVRLWRDGKLLLTKWE